MTQNIYIDTQSTHASMGIRQPDKDTAMYFDRHSKVLLLLPVFYTRGPYPGATKNYRWEQLEGVLEHP